MEPRIVACLRCGNHHRLPAVEWRCLQESECPRCGYVGWTAVAEPPRRTSAPGAQLLRLLRP